jgi:zinc protease
MMQRLKIWVTWAREHKRMIMALVLVMALLMTACQPAYAADTVEEVSGGRVKAWVMRDTSLPMVTLQLTLRHAGAVADPISKEGLSALTARLLTEGAGTYDARAFHEALEFYAMSLRASSGRDDMVISLTTLSEHTDTAFALLGAMLTSPRFDQTEIDRERTEYLSDIKRFEEHSSFVSQRDFFKKTFVGSTYARPAEGTPSSIYALVKTDFQRFVAEQFSKQHIILSVAGDIDDVTLSRLMEKHLAALPAASKQVFPHERIRLRMFAEPVTVKMKIRQTLVKIAFEGIERNDPQFMAAFVMNYMLGGGSLSSRLATEIRKERGLTYSIGSDLAMLDNAAWLSIDFATQNATVKKATDATIEVLQQVSEKGFGDPELIAAKQYLTGSFPLSLDSNAEKVNYLTVMQRYGLGRDYLQRRNRLIDEVTLQQVNTVAKDLLNTQKRLIIHTGDPS